MCRGPPSPSLAASQSCRRACHSSDRTAVFSSQRSSFHPFACALHLSWRKRARTFNHSRNLRKRRRRAILHARGRCAPGRERREPGLRRGGGPRRCDRRRGQELRRASQRPDCPCRAVGRAGCRAASRQKGSVRLRCVTDGDALPDVPGCAVLGAHSPLSQREHASSRGRSQARLLTGLNVWKQCCRPIVIARLAGPLGTACS